MERAEPPEIVLAAFKGESVTRLGLPRLPDLR